MSNYGRETLARTTRDTGPSVARLVAVAFEVAWEVDVDLVSQKHVENF